VLVCSWIPGDISGQNARIVRDKYGFTVGNFVHTMPLGPDSFTFPMQCIQVFYSNDKQRNDQMGGNWKVICSTDVRGRRGDVSIGRLEIAFLKAGKDSDFEGLRNL
jgi:hypothetical protein